jgi:hypothetical protein
MLMSVVQIHLRPPKKRKAVDLQRSTAFFMFVAMEAISGFPSTDRNKKKPAEAGFFYSP